MYGSQEFDAIPLHLPCASMWLSFRTSMGSYFECIEVANNGIVPQCTRIRWSRLQSRLYQEHVMFFKQVQRVASV